MKRAAALAALLLACAAACVLWPVPAAELELEPAVSLRVEARDGTLLRELASRSEGYAAPAHLDALPDHVWQAFVAAEDRRFFAHPGVDPLALLRALREDVRRRRFAQGGSTLAMQLSRLLRPHPRTLIGKLSEAVFALRLTHTLGRRALLEQYLTRIPLGNDVRGVEAAARLYFDRPASALNPMQAALLAALPRSPAALDPLKSPGRAEAAARRVLRAMGRTEEGPLDLSREKLHRAFEAAHFVERVAREAPRGGTVRTTLDLGLQRALEQIVREQVAQLAAKRVTSAAALVLDNATGEVLAYVGSPDWFDEAHAGRIDAVRTRRQPGSALKPFAYAAAMDRGRLTAATLLSDVESHFSTAGGDYMPKNYDRRAHGPVRARVALASSYNVPAVHVAELLSAPELLGTMRRAGFESLTLDAEHYGLGLVLGDGEVSLLELARAYMGLANGGVLRDVRLVPGPVAPGRRFTGATTAALIADMLADASARAPAFGLDNALRFPFPAAAKTGTSRAFTDNWTAGFTRERTVAVWVGNMSGETMQHVSGITGAGALFHRAMALAMEHVDRPAPLFTAALEEHEICAVSGERAGAHCPSRVVERFAPGTAPHAACAMHSAAGLDLGPRFDDWAAREGVHTEPRARSVRASLEFPREGDEFLRSRDAADRYQTIPVRALAPSEAALELQLDDGPRAPLAPPFSTRVPAVRGEHTLRLFERGADRPRSQVSFKVRG